MSKKLSITDEELEDIKESLKRCPEGTFESLIEFRESGSREALDHVVIGILKRHVEPEIESILDKKNLDLDFNNDLGMDSMTKMEVVMMVEECLGIHIENDQLMKIQTYGDLDKFIIEHL